MTFSTEMSINLDPSKQVPEVIQKIDYPALYFNHSYTKETSTQRQPTMLLVFKLNFQVHCKSVLKNVNKIVALLRSYCVNPRIFLRD